MKTFNAIQIVIILMAAPSLLNLLDKAEFSGASALYWVGVIGAVGLSILATVLIRMGMDE